MEQMAMEHAETKSFENPAWPNFLELRQQMKQELPPLRILEQWKKEGRKGGS
jgi:hypothetical protein